MAREVGHNAWDVLRDMRSPAPTYTADLSGTWGKRARPALTSTERSPLSTGRAGFWRRETLDEAENSIATEARL